MQPAGRIARLHIPDALLVTAGTGALIHGLVEAGAAVALVLVPRAKPHMSGPHAHRTRARRA